MQKLDEQDYIRSKLFGSNVSVIRRYADLVVGPEASWWQLLRYEMITMLFGGLPGALGLALRKLFYPRLFRRCGRGVVFGRDLVIRNGHRIALGDNVIIDDACVIDGRGAGPTGIGSATARSSAAACRSRPRSARSGSAATTTSVCTA